MISSDNHAHENVAVGNGNSYAMNLNPHSNTTIYTKVVEDIPNGRPTLPQQKHANTGMTKLAVHEFRDSPSVDGSNAAVATGQTNDGAATPRSEQMNGEAPTGKVATPQSASAPQSSGHLAVPGTQSQQNRYSSPPTFQSSQGNQVPSTPTATTSASPQMLSQHSTPSSPSGLRHRHTLQVPKHTTAGRSAVAQSDEVLASGTGRFSPTITSAPRRASFSLGRRPTRSTHSEFHADEINQDEDSQKWAEAIKAKRASKRRRKVEEIEDEVLVGTKVDMNHTNYVTMYNMLTGIRFVVSFLNFVPIT